MSYNIKFMNESDPITVAQHIKNQNCNVVCLQESYEFNSTHTYTYFDQAKYIADFLGFEYIAYNATFRVEPTNGSIGNAIISRYPMNKSSVITNKDISNAARYYESIHAEILGINVVSAHLKAGSAVASDDHRIKSMNEIDYDLEDKIVICGDFNHIVGRASYNHADSIWKRTKLVGATAGDQRDFIYYNGNLESTGYYIMPDQFYNISDHKGIVSIVMDI